MGHIENTTSTTLPSINKSRSKSLRQQNGEKSQLIKKLGNKVHNLLQFHEKSINKFHTIQHKSLNSNSKDALKRIILRKRRCSRNIQTQEELDMVRVIGKGAFGKVILCTKRSRSKSESNISVRAPSPPTNVNISQKSPNQIRMKQQFIDSTGYYAVKVVDKSLLSTDKAVDQAACEVKVMKSVDHPFIIQLLDAFQSNTKLYLVLDYACGGELFFQLQRCGRFTETRARLYAAETALALGYLHTQGILYRDLKPENLLIDSKGHVKLTDFGLCCKVSKDFGAKTLCGTPAYAAPEILLQREYGFEADWWALGILTYEMIVGIPPFHHPDIQMMYRLICDGPLKLPAHVSVPARSFICQLLRRDVATRLGSTDKGVEEIKTHHFFESLKWQDVEDGKVDPEFVPKLESPTDTQYFDSDFTQLPIMDAQTNEKVARHAIPSAVAATAKATAVLSKIFHHRPEGRSNSIDGFRYTDEVLVTQA